MWLLSFTLFAHVLVYLFLPYTVQKYLFYQQNKAILGNILVGSYNLKGLFED